MKISEANYILFNNRSEDLVERFLPKVDIKKFLDLESKYGFILSTYEDIFDHSLPIDPNDITKDYKDIIYDLKDLQELEDKIKDSNLKRKKASEYQYLIDRNINDKMIEDMGLAFYSYGWTERELEILGATLHPMLKNVFDSQTKSGIIIPFYENGKLVNIVNRKLEQGPLKYCNSIPDIDIYNFDKLKKNDSFWICEGIFDAYVLTSMGYKCISVSSASLSSIQLYKILELDPKEINIFCDYDYTGLRSAHILQRVLRMYGINCRTFISNKHKDVCEHFLENDLTFDDVEEVGITKDLLNILEPEETEKVKSYFSYLKNKYIPV